MIRDKEITHKIMSSVKSKNTTPEILLCKELWKHGLRYRKHYKKLIGKPDIVFIRKKVAIFCDGDFWHGNNWKIRGLNNLEQELSRYSDFWKQKIMRNIHRDSLVTEALQNEGWKVLRIWESDIRKNLNDCVNRIINILNNN